MRRDHDASVAARHGHLDPVRRSQPAGAAHPLDVVLAEELLDAARQAGDDAVLPAHHRLQVQLCLSHLDAVSGYCVSDLVVQLTGVEQRFGRDTADVEAGATQRCIALDAGGAEAELGGADRGNIAARAAADDREVERGFLGRWHRVRLTRPRAAALPGLRPAL